MHDRSRVQRCVAVLQVAAAESARKFGKWADRNGRLGNIARLGSGMAIGQAMLVLVTPALTRLYLPADVGAAALFASLLLLASSFACARYECAIGVAPAPERDLLTLLCFSLTVPVALLAGIVLIVLIRAAAFGFGALPVWSSVAMGVLVVLTGCFTALRFWFVAHSGFSRIAASLIWQGFGRALVPLLVAPLAWGWAGLMAGDVAGRLLGIRALFGVARARLRAAFRLGLGRQLDCLVRYRVFPLSYVPGVGLSAAANALPLPLTASFFGVSATGVFALAYRVIMAPSSLICGAVADVFQARIVEAVRADRHAVHAVLRSGALRLAALAMVVYLPLAILALISFRWIFGSGWAEAGAVAAALAPHAASGVVVNPLSRALFVSRVPQWKLLSDTARLVLPVGGLWLAAMSGASLAAAVLAYSLLGVVADGIYLLVIWYCAAPARQRELG